MGPATIVGLVAGGVKAVLPFVPKGSKRKVAAKVARMLEEKAQGLAGWLDEKVRDGLSQDAIELVAANVKEMGELADSIADILVGEDEEEERSG